MLLGGWARILFALLRKRWESQRAEAYELPWEGKEGLCVAAQEFQSGMRTFPPAAVQSAQRRHGICVQTARSDFGNRGWKTSFLLSVHRGQPRASSRAGTRPQIIKWTAKLVSYRFQVRLPPLIRTLELGEDPLCSVNQQKVRLVVVKTPEGTANTHTKVEWKARNAAQNLVRKWITLLLPLCLGRTLWLRPDGWYGGGIG